jgi:protein TonB
LAPAAEHRTAETRPVAVLASPFPQDPPRPPPQVSINAVQYRILPPVELPRASRRAGESGTVWLRVRVDVTGAPAAVSLHQSSGHARLDEQALWAMRQARFKPYAEDGRALEVEVIAPVEYPAA